MPTYEYEVQFVDANGYETSKRYTSQDLTDFAAARAAADALLLDIQALTTAAVIRDRLTEVTYITETPDPASNVYERVDATLVLETPGKKANHKFPSPIDGVFAGNALNVGATEWVDYVANFETAGDWTISDGETVDAVEPTTKGRRVFTRGG